MDQTYNDDQQRYYLQQAANATGLAPITPRPPADTSGGFVNWIKANPWLFLIVVIVIVLLLWWFCFRKKVSTTEVTLTRPSGNGSGSVTVSKVRGNGNMY